jgi:hypothetical protein
MDDQQMIKELVDKARAAQKQIGRCTKTTILTYVRKAPWKKAAWGFMKTN